MNRGDIILISFPFTDLKTTKVRPAVVVSSDIINQNVNREDIIVAAISSQTHKTGPLDILADPLQDGSLGLKRTSLVKADKIFTVSKSLAKRFLGSMPSHLVQLLNEKLSVALALQPQES